MKFVIFSYHRGQFLEHCVRSIERCAPGHAIVVYDDASTDAETCQVLARIAQKHTVISRAVAGEHKHGGLYANMQAAYETVRDDAYVCYLQDDMQLVRPFTQADTEAIERYFDMVPTSAFLSPVFAKGPPRDLDPDETRFDPVSNAYFPTHDRRSVGTYFSDVSIFRPDRLRGVDWQFEAGEAANERRAKRDFSPMGLMREPIAMWLPYGPVYRGRRRTLAIRMAERKHACGFYPFEILADDQVATLRARPDQRLPVAEQYLVTNPPHPAGFWLYTPLSGSRFYKKLNSLEVFLRRVLGG